MDVNALISMLTDGLSPEEASAVRKSIERDAVKTKVAGLKQEDEYNTLSTRLAQAQAELEGDAAQGRLGAKAYEKWYRDNYETVKQVYADVAKYKEKYGSLDMPTTTTQGAAPGMTKEQIQALIQEQFNGQYAPRTVSVIKDTGRLLQRHFLAGRKNEIPFDELDKMMAEKGLSLDAAYEAWDKPEREKVETEARKAEVERMVQERLQQERSRQQFPGGADFTPGSMSQRTKEEGDKFDPVALKQQMARDWATAGVAE